MRADAVRNRQRILDAASSAFRAAGSGAQIEDIARSAGIGVGTVYRHFPDKRALLDAVAAARVEEVAHHAARLRESGAPQGRVQALLRWYLARAHDDAVLRIVFGQDAQHLSSLVRTAIADSQPAVDQLIALDIADGLLRPDVGFADFRALCAAVTATMSVGMPDTAWERVLEIVLVGIRPSGSGGTGA